MLYSSPAAQFFSAACFPRLAELQCRQLRSSLRYTFQPASEQIGSPGMSSIKPLRSIPFGSWGERHAPHDFTACLFLGFRLICTRLQFTMSAFALKKWKQLDRMIQHIAGMEMIEYQTVRLLAAVRQAGLQSEEPF